MKRTTFRIRLCTVLVICNLAFIWGNSLIPGAVSGAISDFVKGILSLFLPSLGPGTPEGSHFVRKLAHFTEFCCLGLCLSWRIGMTRGKFRVRALVFGFLTACVDETIQIFVPGRGPGIRDVAIDTWGAALGILLVAGVQYLYSRRRTI